jgi:cyclopropane fatty-acyl-phospholipid synthase-like methyltransferase
VASDESTEPSEPSEPTEPTEPSFDAPTAPISPISMTEVEEFEEVEADAIESLDVADLVETETEPESAPEPEADGHEAKPRTQPPEPQQKRRKAWYDDVFAEHFMFLFPQTWDETAQRDAQFIHDQLGLREGASVLDVGCGDGHHAIALAKLGHNVTGIDNSLAMLLAAAQQKEAAGIDDQRVTFMHGDMRRLPRDREFEAVICVGTTFGYFEEEQNRQCLQEMFDRLAVGGRLLLHVFNRDFVAPHLPSRSWWQGRRCMVIDEAEMNFFANRLRVHRTIIFDDGRQYEHFMFMRAYTVQDLGKAMSQLGLRVVEVSGSRDTRARFYGSASPDIWIVAERK